MNQRAQLKQKLSQVKAIFDINSITALSSGNDATRNYYNKSKLLYTLIHKFDDRIYMGLSYDGIYKDEDRLEIARIVESYIGQSKAKKVLELATGRGANSYYLAQKFPKTKFYGLDISEGQLERAFNKAGRVNNYFPSFGDYHDLSRFEGSSFDLVFVVEALCYSIRKEVVLKQVKRVLKKGGLFIIFDGYSKRSLGKLSADEVVAMKLTEKGFALEEFENYRKFINKVKKSGLKIEQDKDLTRYILPTQIRLERLSNPFFRNPKIAKFIKRFVPNVVLLNGVSAQLMRLTTQMGLFCYHLTVLKK